MILSMRGLASYWRDNVEPGSQALHSRFHFDRLVHHGSRASGAIRLSSDPHVAQLQISLRPLDDALVKPNDADRIIRHEVASGGGEITGFREI